MSAAAYVVVLKHDRLNNEIGFLVFGNGFDERLRHLNNKIPCFRKFWRYDEVVEHITGRFKDIQLPDEYIEQVAAFMSVDDIQPCWLYVKPNVGHNSPFLRDYHRMKRFVMKMKSRDGALPISESHQLNSKEMLGFDLVAAKTITFTVGWKKDIRCC